MWVRKGAVGREDLGGAGERRGRGAEGELTEWKSGGAVGRVGKRWVERKGGGHPHRKAHTARVFSAGYQNKKGPKQKVPNKKGPTTKGTNTNGTNKKVPNKNGTNKNRYQK